MDGEQRAVEDVSVSARPEPNESVCHLGRLRVTVVRLTAAAKVSTVERPNIAIVMLDTTRGDRLGAYGLRAATPTIDRGSREGTVFTQAVSVPLLRLRSHTSLFTGLYPPRHGVRDNTDRLLSGDTPLLAEILHERGFGTAAFVGTVLTKDVLPTEVLDGHLPCALTLPSWSLVSSCCSRIHAGPPKRAAGLS